jgi:hypothetical protein
MKSAPVFFVCCLLLLLAACHPATLETVSGVNTFENVVCDMVADKVKSGESVAVIAFYDGVRGDYTALGDQWRGRAESALAGSGVEVKASRDMGLILNSLETTDRDFNESEVWRNSGSDYLLAGCYYIEKKVGKEEADYLELQLKLLRVCDQKVVGGEPWRIRLEGNWQQKIAVIRGNIYQKAIEVIGPDLDRAESRPQLVAELDRKPPCYPTASGASLKIKSEAGVYLYILNISADRSVTIVYPNRYLKGKALVSADFRFPPPDLPDMRLELYPMPNDDPSREAFKVIASYKSLNFSFLKVPDGQIFAGAEAAALKEVLAVLQKASGWSEVTLPYVVGRGCY